MHKCTCVPVFSWTCVEVDMFICAHICTGVKFFSWTCVCSVVNVKRPLYVEVCTCIHVHVSRCMKIMRVSTVSAQILPVSKTTSSPLCLSEWTVR